MHGCSYEIAKANTYVHTLEHNTTCTISSGKERIQVLCRQSGQLYSLIALGELNELHMGRFSGVWEVFAHLSYYQ